jgi:four helix bundle protein
MGANTKNYFELIKTKMDTYVHFVYSVTKNFPKDELYGCTSQLRRSTLSIILNFIEGFARQKIAVKRNFWEISYGSLQESKYLLNFSFEEKYISLENYQKANKMADEIGAMLWQALKPLYDDSMLK